MADPTASELLLSPQKFVDKDKDANLHDGLEYYAAGLVVGYGRPDSVDRQVQVAYLDPWGTLANAWRRLDEIEISSIELSDANLLRSRFDAIDKFNQSGL